MFKSSHYGFKNALIVCQKFKLFTSLLVLCAASSFLPILNQSVTKVSFQRTSLMKRNMLYVFPHVSLFLALCGVITLGDLFVTDWHIGFY